MELARAFTTRHKKQEMVITSPMYIGRAASQRGGRPVRRSAISSPLALVSTSNTQLHNAQAIAGASPIEIRTVSSGSSVMSSLADDSDASSNHRSTGTVTDASSIDESPVESTATDNHLSCYFKPAVDTQMKSPAQSPTSATFSSIDTPRLPQRVPSHSKRAHETVHRKNSVKRMLSPPPSTSREMMRSSPDVFSSKASSIVEAPRENPFGNELAQLDEVAEEFGQVVLDAESAADYKVMTSRGLASYRATDYLSEIQDLLYQTYAEQKPEVPSWI